MLRPLSLLLSLSILLGAPGLPAWQAAAAVALRPVPTGAAAAAWGGAVGGLLHHAAAAPLPGLGAGLENTLGHVRFAVDAQPGASPAALAFVAHLPAGLKPETFSAMTPEAQARLLAPAVAAVSADLQPRAQALLARVGDEKLSAADRMELQELEASWFYLEPGTARTVRALAKADRMGGALDLAGGIARALNKKAPDQAKLESDAAAAAELDFVLAGAARLAQENAGRLGRPGPRGPAAGLTRDVLAPYLARALDRAAVLQQERGMDPKAVATRVLESHVLVFGGKAAKPALRALRPAGEWTEFVAAASLHAAFTLADAPGAAETLRKAAADAHLRMAIPAWHGASAEGAATVAHLIASRHGVEPASFPEKGRLFTAFGIPVRADLGFYLFAAVGAMQLGSNFFAKASNPLLLGAAAIVLVYATLLGHEFAHALTARRYGVKTHGISLNFLGGAAHIEREPRSAKAEFLIAAAGPAFNLLYAAAVVPLSFLLDPGPVRAVLLFSAWANVLLGVMNLVPAYPMDGGRLLRSGLAALLKDHYKATHAAAWVGLVLGLGVSLWSWLQFASTGSWAILFNVVIGLFVVMGSRAAMLHPGTELRDELIPGETPAKRP